MIANQRGLGSQRSELKWGDQTINTGYYMGILATEYHQLAKNNQKTNQTVKELYYALWAINRLDLNAESMYRSTYSGSPDPQPGDLNGYISRDDVDDHFYDQNFEHFNSDKIQSQATLAAGNFSSDWQHDELYHFPSILQADGGVNEMSQDQVYQMMAGLALITKFLPEGVSHENIPFQDNLVGIKEEAEAILMRLIGHCNGTSRAESLYFAWRIKNAVTGNNVGRGHNMGTWSHGAGDAACVVMGGYCAPAPAQTDYVSYVHNNYSQNNLIPFSFQVTSGAPYATSQDNSTMFATILAVKGQSNMTPAHANGYTVREIEHIPLLRQVLHGGSNPIGDEFYQYLLNTAPCEGPYNYGPYNWGGGVQWSSTDRLLHPSRRGFDDDGNLNNHLLAEYPGLDYMLYHNLYYMVRDEHYPAPYDMVNNIISTPLPINYGIVELGTDELPFEAGLFNTLVANNLISAAGTNPVEDGNANVTYRAGCEITLEPGFQVENGATFYAYIDPYECAEDGTYRQGTVDSGRPFSGLFMTEGFEPHHEPQDIVDYGFRFDQSEDAIAGYNPEEQRKPSASPLSVYPNPTANHVTLDLSAYSDFEEAEISFRDEIGREVLRLHSETEITSVDISNLNAGIYGVSVSVNGTTTLFEKIVRQ